MNEPQEFQVATPRPKPTAIDAFAHAQLQLLERRRIISSLHHPSRWLINGQD